MRSFPRFPAPEFPRSPAPAFSRSPAPSFPSSEVLKFAPFPSSLALHRPLPPPGVQPPAVSRSGSGLSPPRCHLQQRRSHADTRLDLWNRSAIHYYCVLFNDQEELRVSGGFAAATPKGRCNEAPRPHSAPVRRTRSNKIRARCVPIMRTYHEYVEYHAYVVWIRGSRAYVE